MIKGNYKNKTVFVPHYVMQDKLWRWEQENQVRPQNLLDWLLNDVAWPDGTSHINYAHTAAAAYPVHVAGNVTTPAGTVYFAWVPLTDGHKLLIEFAEKDLYAQAACAGVEHWAHEDRTQREIKRAEQCRAALYRYARCYHHTPKKPTAWQRVKDFLAKKDQAGTSIPTCDERAKGGAQTLPAPIFARRVL